MQLHIHPSTLSVKNNHSWNGDNSNINKRTSHTYTRTHTHKGKTCAHKHTSHNSDPEFMVLPVGSQLHKSDLLWHPLEIHQRDREKEREQLIIIRALLLHPTTKYTYRNTTPFNGAMHGCMRQCSISVHWVHLTWSLLLSKHGMSKHGKDKLFFLS